jgi:photosystem II stability/assembly factor-like uncharacterized protein
MIKPIKSIPIILIIIFSCQFFVNAQWEKTNGPAGAQITSVTTDKNFLYAGSSDGYIFHSTDGGSLWSGGKIEVTDAGTAGLTRSICAKDNLVFASINCAGIFKSTDYGNSWKPTSVTYQYVYNIVRIDSLFFYCSNLGVFRSSNSGETWDKINSKASSLAAMGNYLFTPDSLSKDFGATWSRNKIPSDFSSDDFCLVAATDSVVYLSNVYVGQNREMFKSSDKGATWVQVNSYTVAKCLYAYGSDVYIIEYFPTNDFYHSSDYGNTWSIVHAVDLPFLASSYIAYNSHLLAGCNKGIFISTDKGTTWTESSKGLNESTVYSLKKYGSKLYAATNSGVSATSAGIIDWENITGNMGKFQNNALCFCDSSLYVGNSNGLYKSDINNINWNNVGFTGANITALTTMNGYVYIGSDIINPERTQNDGISWSVVNCPKINCIDQNGTVLLAGTKQGVYLSTDNGNSFSYKGLEFIDMYYYSFNSVAIYKNTYFAGDKYGFYRLVNDGSEYETLLIGAVYTIAASDSRIYVSNASGLFMSTDGGDTWTSINTGLEGITVYSILEDGGYLYVGASGLGVWRKPISQLITSVKIKDVLPASFALLQNYPNPFNPSTTINYQLPKASKVSLKVYDVLGQKIMTLVNGDMGAGVHSVTFNAGKLASGVYLYRLDAGTYSQSRKMILTK